MADVCHGLTGQNAAGEVARATMSTSIPLSLSEGDSADARRVTIDQQEHLAAVLRARRVFAYSAAVWFGSVVLDLLAVTFVEPSPFGYFLALRVVGTVAIALSSAVLYLRPNVTARQLQALDLLLHVFICALVALMALRYRGLASPYAHGISCILVARGITLSDRWQRAIALMGIPALIYPVTLLLAAPSTPLIARQLHDPSALAIFAQNMVWVSSTFGLLVIGSHLVWSLRRQVFEARNLGRYKLQVRIGKGGMGEVWRAFHQGLRRDVAVKILSPEISRGEVAIARFEREVRATAELTHPNTVRVFDYGVTPDGLWYYAMELLQGETLAQVVEREGPLPEARVLHLIAQAARALSEAHTRGIVHRDIKPENLFVTAAGAEGDFIKVLDFGVAKLARTDAGATLTGDESFLGTPKYMAPEQVLGGAVDARTDVYALGGAMYFALTAHAPFIGDNPRAVMFARIQHTPERPSVRLGRPVSEALEAVVMKCLAREPAERFPSAQAALDALAPLLAAHPWNPPQVTLPQHARLSDVGAQNQSGERPSRRGLWGVGARASKP